MAWLAIQDDSRLRIELECFERCFASGTIEIDRNKLNAFQNETIFNLIRLNVFAWMRWDTIFFSLCVRCADFLHAKRSHIEKRYIFFLCCIPCLRIVHMSCGRLVHAFAHVLTSTTFFSVSDLRTSDAAIGTMWMDMDVYVQHTGCDVCIRRRIISMRLNVFSLPYHFVTQTFLFFCGRHSLVTYARLYRLKMCGRAFDGERKRGKESEREGGREGHMVKQNEFCWLDVSLCQLCSLDTYSAVTRYPHSHAHVVVMWTDFLTRENEMDYVGGQQRLRWWRTMVKLK